MSPILVFDLKNAFVLISVHISYGLDIQKPWSSPNLGFWTLLAPKIHGIKLKEQRSLFMSASVHYICHLEEKGAFLIQD